jgi:hypothetical protein
MGVKKDKSAERAAAQARRDETARQGRISEGRASIDAAFTPFNDDYFKGVEQDYLGYHLPQIDDQYKKAQEQATYALARSGNLNAGSASNRVFADLLEEYNKQRTLYGDRALGAAGEARAQVEQNRQELYGQNVASADPTAAAGAAAASVGKLRLPQQYSPLGTLFADAIGSAATGIVAEREGYPGFQVGIRTPQTTTGSARSSGRVVPT